MCKLLFFETLYCSPDFIRKLEIQKHNAKRYIVSPVRMQYFNCDGKVFVVPAQNRGQSTELPVFYISLSTLYEPRDIL